MHKDLIYQIFSLQNQIKLYHWATTSYAVHKALDKLYNSLLPLTDNLMESFLGSSTPISKIQIDISISSDTSQIVKFISKNILSLRKIRKELKTPELQNIIDEIIANINQTLYLLRLT